MYLLSTLKKLEGSNFEVGEGSSVREETSGKCTVCIHYTLYTIWGYSFTFVYDKGKGFCSLNDCPVLRDTLNLLLYIL